MKLTQGTGRGTCWWNKIKIIFYFFGFKQVNLLNFFMSFLESIHININFYLFSFEELLIILFLFSIAKLIILCIVIELIWPTHFFNKRHNINFQTLKLRDFQSVLLKLRIKSKGYYMLKSFWNFYLYRS